MKSPLIVILSIIGILGTATAAMAVNSGTLGAVDQGTIGRAAQVLVPVGTATPTPEATSAPSPTPTAEELNDTSSSNGQHVFEPTPDTEHVDATSGADDSSVAKHDAGETEHSSTERDD
jgi:hypothetical protein